MAGYEHPRQFEKELIELGEIRVRAAEGEREGKRSFFLLRFKEGERVIDVIGRVAQPGYHVATLHEAKELVADPSVPKKDVDFLATATDWIDYAFDSSDWTVEGPGYSHRLQMGCGSRELSSALHRYFLSRAFQNRNDRSSALLLVKDA